MGMFDYIRCEIPLPDGFTGTFQTKDFECDLVEHVITRDGQLLLSKIDKVENVPKAQRPYPNDDGIAGIIGSVKVHTHLENSNFHGILNFYGCGPNNEWHEYNAKFTNGRLISIEMV